MDFDIPIGNLENQEGEIIGEGSVSIVYKALINPKKGVQMAFKVFKVTIRSSRNY